jgi:hypothetical protein
MSKKDPCGKCALLTACVESYGSRETKGMPPCARAERRKRVRLDKALAWIAQQPCRAEAEGADGKHITCRETGACATEWCLPCYAVGAGLELKGE